MVSSDVRVLGRESELAVVKEAEKIIQKKLVTQLARDEKRKSQVWRPIHCNLNHKIDSDIFLLYWYWSVSTTSLTAYYMTAEDNQAKFKLLQ